MTAPDAAWEFFGTAPKWVSALMRVRNAIVSLFGLKTGKDAALRPEKTTLVRGQKVGLFRIYEADDSEVILGEDDKHLNFRVSVFLPAAEKDPALKRTLTVSTVVHFNNVFGRIYFFFVRPFHRLVVPAMFRRMLKQTG